MTVRLLAPAKLTLSLKVVGIREDGFHNIEAEMVTIDLCDEIVLAEGPLTLRTEGLNKHLGEQSKNSVIKAMKLVGEERSVNLRKNIPTQAGLGGGSADAAAILRWANFKDMDAASKLGADVPFCVQGGQAIVTGIGEVVSPVAFQEQDFTIYTPPKGCSTPVVYQEWDNLGGPKGTNGNDLEPAALSAYPDLAKAKDYLGNVANQEPRLAGSGSTWFVEGHHEGTGLVQCRSVDY